MATVEELAALAVLLEVDSQDAALDLVTDN
jgi:hypothetical protein